MKILRAKSCKASHDPWSFPIEFLPSEETAAIPPRCNGGVQREDRTRIGFGVVLALLTVHILEDSQNVCGRCRLVDRLVTSVHVSPPWPHGRRLG